MSFEKYPLAEVIEDAAHPPPEGSLAGHTRARGPAARRRIAAWARHRSCRRERIREVHSDRRHRHRIRAFRRRWFRQRASRDPRLRVVASGPHPAATSCRRKSPRVFSSGGNDARILHLPGANEPESALSLSGCVALVVALTELLEAGDCQVLIATHSPVLAALPGAEIYEVGE